MNKVDEGEEDGLCMVCVFPPCLCILTLLDRRIDHVHQTIENTFNFDDKGAKEIKIGQIPISFEQNGCHSAGARKCALLMMTKTCHNPEFKTTLLVYLRQLSYTI